MNDICVELLKNPAPLIYLNKDHPLFDNLHIFELLIKDI
jgi:hypothetical protein